MGTTNMKRGFTLIELLVAVAIMGVLVGGGIATYRTFNTKQEVMNAGKEYVQLLRVAQKKAKSGEKPAGCDRLVGYRAQVASGGSTVTIYALCENGSVYDSEKIFPAGIQFSSDTTFDFLVLSGGVNGAGTVEITNSVGTYTYQVEVTSAGSIAGAEI